jgi:O-antigen ligase
LNKIVHSTGKALSGTRSGRGRSRKVERRPFRQRIGLPSGLQLQTILTMLAIVVMMLLGGGVPGVLTTSVIAAAGLVMLGTIAVTDGLRGLRDQPLAFRLGLIGIALLPLLQLVPLPPAWWQALPGGDLRTEILALVGLENSWQPISLTPLFTSRTAAIAITFVALVTLLLAVPADQFRRLGWLILALVGINILVGLVQIASGGQALQLHRIAHQDALLGLFANKNHVAMVLAASLPLAAYLLSSRENAKDSRAWLGVYAGIVLVAIVATNSRAGLFLGLVAALLLGSLYIRAVKPVYLLTGAAVLILSLVLVSMTSAFDIVFSRFGNVEDDGRWQFLSTSIPLIERYWLTGSGLGSFSTLYATQEGLASITPAYVNQLHNEYPQLLLEAGVAGVALLLCLLAGGVWSAVRSWRSGAKDRRLASLCGALTLGLVAAHSLVDYPLRRPATLPVLALAIAMVVRGDLVALSAGARRKHRP